MEGKNLAKLLGCLCLCTVAAAIGSCLTVPVVARWHVDLAMPSIMPPTWAFTPMCLMIFLLQGIGLYLLWQKRTIREIYLAIIIFLVQIVFNIGWLFTFFGERMPVVAAIEAATALPLIALLIYEVYKLNKHAAFLFSFAVLCVTYRMAISIATALVN